MKRSRFIYIAFISLLFSCDKNSSTDTTAVTGAAGSLSRFTIIGNYIYAVSNHYLYTVDISDPAHPVKTQESLLNFDMETIYPYKNRLFIGSMTGIYIYSIDTASTPRLIGTAKHGRSCDPVTANDTVSYATLKSNSGCGPAESGLYVYNIKDLDNPALLETIAIDQPSGLGMADSALYVCTNGGLKIFSIKNAYNPVEKRTITGSDFTDVIPYYNILICWISDGISLYDITNRLNPVFIKKIAN